MSKNANFSPDSTAASKKVDHHRMVLCYARFMARQHKPFSVDDYVKFQERRVEREKVRKIFAGHLKLGRFSLDEHGYSMTDKGFRDLLKIEAKIAIREAEKREKDYRAKGFARPNLRDRDGKYLRTSE